MKHEIEKIKDLAHKFNVILSGQQKLYGGMILICTIFAAFMETLGISAILPIIEGLMTPEGLVNKWYLRPFVSIFHIQETQTLILVVCGEVIILYVVKNMYFIFHTWLVRKYTYKIKRELGSVVMQSYMKRGYIFFVNNNTSKLIQGITNDINSINVILSGIFNLVTKAMTMAAISVYMFMKTPSIATVLVVLAVVSVLAIQLFYKKSLRKYGVLLRIAERENYQVSLEAIHGNKEIQVTRRQDYYIKRYRDTMNDHIKASIKIDMSTLTPGYIIEMICISGLLLAIAFQTRAGGVPQEMLSSLSVVAVSAFRIFPSIAAVSSTLNTIRGRMPSFNAAYENIKQIKEEKTEGAQAALQDHGELEENIDFKEEIKFNNVSYRYPNTEKYILKDMNFTIKAKTSIGLIGPSGAGKSTMVDVLLGLLIPEQGSITMDGEDIQKLGIEWNRNVGYVPQSVYLTDSSIRKNIAFGIPEGQIDDARVWNALEMAQLSEFVKKLPNGLETQVGDRGIKFSGGQRQRVAIARALYMNPDILILDEATAALDNETEHSLMDAIESLQGKKTLVIVAHRLTTIRHCDYIYEVVEGKIIERDKAEVFSELYT